MRQTPILAAACVAALTAVTGPAAAASPAPAGVTADLRCLITMGAVASDKAHQVAGLTGVYFFAGRISRESPGFDFAKGLATEAPKLRTQAALRAELARCAPLVEQTSLTLRNAQQALAPPGAAPPAPAAPPPQGGLVPMPGTGPN